MVYSEETLTQIEQYASIYLKISDMAVILGVPPETLRRDIADRSTTFGEQDIYLPIPIGRCKGPVWRCR